MRLNGNISALASGAWTFIVSKTRAVWNMWVDPPRRHLKFYFWLVLGVSVFGWFLWNPVLGRVHRFFNPTHVAINQPYGLISPQEVITTVPPPAPIASVDPPTVKVVEAPAKPKKKIKRKPKCEGIFC